MGIYKKLLKVQEQVKGLGKDRKTGQGNYGYEYVTGSKLLEHIKPILNQEKLILKQEIVSVEKERIDYKTKNGEKSEMLFSVWQKFTWIDTETGERDENSFFASGMNEWEKGLGSALTYAERYFLLKYFHIATDEDDIDNTARKNNDLVSLEPIIKELKKEELKISQIQIDSIVDLMEKTKSNLTKFLDYFKVAEISQMTAKQAIEAIKMLEKNLK